MRRAVPSLLLVLLASCSPSRSERIGISAPHEIRTLDPHVKNALSSFSVLLHFYEPLVTTDGGMKIRPCLARLWENPDPSTWVFHLRPGVSFHSGRPLRAEDVVYTFKRLTATRGLEVTGYVLYITEARVIDALTVQIRTARPMSVLLNKLRFVPIIPEGTTGEALAEHPDGTGPFTLLEWKQDGVLRLTRNERYWGPRPAVGSVDLYLDRSPDEAARDLLSGRSQLVQCNSREAAARVRGAGRFEVQKRPNMFLKYLGFDVFRDVSPHVARRPNPFLDKRVRRAVHLAVDRERLVAGLSSDAVPAGQLVPPSIFGFNPQLPPPVHDLAQARALLAEAGLQGGFGATLHARKFLADAALLVRDQLGLLGIALDVETLDDSAFLDAAQQRAFSFYLSRFGCPTGDASDILDTALHTTDAARHLGMNNAEGYSNPEVDRAIEESAGIEGLQARRAALEAIVARIMDDLPWVPLYVDQDVYALDRAFSWQPRNDSFILAAEISHR